VEPEAFPLPILTSCYGRKPPQDSKGNILRKLLLAVLLSLAVLPFQALAFTQDECAEAAQNVYAAQTLLNASKEIFDAATAKVESAPASDLEWSEELKSFILSIAKKLKPGADPQKVGMAVFEGCKANLKAI
jgi:hypothetical protein